MSNNSQLFHSITLRKLEIKNRIFMSPMCQYSSDESGVAQPWHLVHYGARATGGVGLIVQEATAISSEGRISNRDLGLWNMAQSASMKPITTFIKNQGSVPAIQLAHAGRKGNAGVSIVAPSKIKFDSDFAEPIELNVEGIKKIVDDFGRSAELALEAGFLASEIHMAHGYLLHEFLSPLTNQRKDEYGGSLENRMRLPLMVAMVVRQQWPSEFPVFVRISATDWVPGGWDLEQSIVLAKKLKEIGIDLIDCSSGGATPDAKIPVEPNYQVPFSEAIKNQAQINTGAVGMITDAYQAQSILEQEKADVILLGRELLRDPYWSLKAAKNLEHNLKWPTQYERAK